MKQIRALNVSDAYRLRVLNYQQIRAVFGETFAEGVMHRLEARASAFLLDSGLRPDVGLYGSVVDLSAGLKQLAHLDGRFALEILACAVASEPVRIGDDSVIVALDEHPHDATLDRLPVSASAETISADEYRLLMQRAVDAYRAVEDGHLSFAHQPVRASDGTAPLYEEVLARITVGRDGDVPISPACFIPAMERLGLMRLFDRQVVSSTIAALRRSPNARLGCNISASSAVPDLYWEAAFASLAADPELASRFTVEVTETVPVPDLATASAFFSRLQSFGCMVALDDFGVGFTSIGQALALRPDIIKLDSSFVRHAIDWVFGGELLASLIALASQLAPQVVVEGVEDERHSRAARTAGAHWLQGYHIGAPVPQCATFSSGRPSSTPPVATVTPSGAPMVNGWARP